MARFHAHTDVLEWTSGRRITPMVLVSTMRTIYIHLQCVSFVTWVEEVLCAAPAAATRTWTLCTSRALHQTRAKKIEMLPALSSPISSFWHVFHPLPADFTHVPLGTG